MTSPAQMLSNRRNGAQSTGPVTEEGKAHSARNALKHGYCAADIVVPGEDAAQFERLLESVQADWQPASETERELADEIAVGLWRRRRLRRVEADLWAERLALTSGEPRTLGQAFAADSDSAGHAIEKLRRWWQGNERHLNRCHDKLALVKRLARALEKPLPSGMARERRRHAAREIDLTIDAPMLDGGELPLPLAGTDPEYEIGKSAERTQSPNGQPNQATVPERARPPVPVSHSQAGPGSLPRNARRALLRKMAKEHRKQEKRARQTVAA